MATKQNRQLAEKVQEIKRMQANWMRQRSAQDGGDSGVKVQKSGSSHRQNRDKKRTGETRKEVPNKQETMTWMISGGSNKKKNLRARSASPAGRQENTALNKQHPVGQTRPSSGRSSHGSRPISSRDSNCSSKPPMARGSRSDRTPSKNNQTNVQLSSRSGSEPNLCASVSKHESHSGKVPPERQSTIHRTSYERDPISGLDNADSTNQSETRASNFIQSDKTEDRLKSSDIQSRTCDQSDLARNFPGQSEKRTVGHDLLEPDAFDRLADQIASKVKAEMRQEREAIHLSAGIPLKIVLDEDDGEESSVLSSHHCIKCKQKMVPPDHKPTVLVPCGHTFCEPCAEDRIKCPTCRTKVSSTAENSTLLEIILGSTPSKRNHSVNKQIQHLTNQNPVPTSNHRYQPMDYTSNDNSHSGDDSKRSNCENNQQWSESDVKRNLSSGQNNNIEKSAVRKRTADPKVRAANYVSEFESLSIRCEAMREEEETIMEDVEKTNREMMQHRKQIGNISRQQDQIREEIQQLQEKISLLDEHRAEYERKCEDLGEDKAEKTSQLHMVRQMLRQLEGSKDKVRMLARDLGVYLE